MTQGGSPALRCRGLSVRVGDRLLLRSIDLDVTAGEAVAVTGPSGSGKTTLLHALAGIDATTTGTVEIDGRRIQPVRPSTRARVRRERIGLVFQFGELFEELTVAENVAVALQLRGRAEPARVQEMLDAVGLGGRGSAWPGELSGGEVQRVGIARALAGAPRAVLADEPTGALDEQRSLEICELLRRTTRQAGAALVVATHDPVVRDQMDRALQLREGSLVAC